MTPKDTGEDARPGEAARRRELHLDLCGLKCPLPALKARKALRGMRPGEVLVLACTDPMAALDIPNLARETGDALEARSEAGGLLSFRLVKS